MKHLLLTFCIFLCSCLFEEAESTSSLLPCPPSHIIFVTSSSVEPDPLILECPLEDITEYPAYDVIPDDWCETAMLGGCAFKLKTSKEELSFNAQGGVRCITTDRLFGLYGGYDSDNYYELSCTKEEEVEEVSNDPYISYWRILKCPGEYPWLTATKVDTRVIHISVNKNETGSERKLYIHSSCQANISITQSAD